MMLLGGHWNRYYISSSVIQQEFFSFAGIAYYWACWVSSEKGESIFMRVHFSRWDWQ